MMLENLNIIKEKKLIKYIVLIANGIIITYFLVIGMFGELIIPPGEFLGMFIKSLVLDPILWAVIVYIIFSKKVIKINEDSILNPILIYGLEIFLFALLYFKRDFSPFIIYLIIILSTSMLYLETFKDQ